MKPAQTAPSDLLAILATVAERPCILKCEKGRVAFNQGDRADSVYYILKGKVELTVVSSQGRRAIVGILEPRDFFGEPCLGEHPLRIVTARTIMPSTLVKIAKPVMLQLMRGVPSFAAFFTSCLLSRNVRLQEDLIDQLFNSVEKRLARALLLMAGVSENGGIKAVIPEVNQETLAEMIGTSRQRVNFFMSKFRQLGLIEYDYGCSPRLLVHSSLLSVVLND